MDAEFDRWCFIAESNVVAEVKPGFHAPLPLITVLLHSVCDGNESKFEQAVEMLRCAFKAGRDSAKD